MLNASSVFPTERKSGNAALNVVLTRPQNPPQGSPRNDEPPIIQTKAKMSHVLTRGSNSEFGMESMFQSSRCVAEDFTSSLD